MEGWGQNLLACLVYILSPTSRVILGSRGKVSFNALVGILFGLEAMGKLANRKVGWYLEFREGTHCCGSQ